MRPAQSHSKWFIKKLTSPEERLRLFALPYAGGGASIFRNWEAELPPNVGVYAVQAPGRENRISEAPFTSMDAMVKTISQTMAPYLDLPFFLFGHSLGARVAFELARTLRNTWGVEPRHLIVSASRGPHIPEPMPLHHLPYPAFITELQRFSGTPKAVFQNRELMALLLPMLRADFTIDETYHFQEAPPLDCPITVIGGTSDPEATQDELIAWAPHTTSRFSLKMIDGDHFFLVDQQKTLLNKIATLIKEEMHDLVPLAQTAPAFT